MKLFLDAQRYIDTSQPLDISLGLSNTPSNPRAWYVDPPTFEPVRTEHYTGSVAEGGSVNFRDIFFNPHGHGTHTECLGHITKEVHSINEKLQEYFFEAQVISIEPITRENGKDSDRVITLEQMKAQDIKKEALILRTLPNSTEKRTMNYSDSNPAFLEREIAAYLIEQGVKHFLLDLPSVDRESDGGELAFHHDFWEVPQNPNHERTITELIYVPNSISDGEYIMNLQVAPFENDAAPSRPVLYKVEQK
ncbi:MAG: cyclase family protein [bacterium]|nr:cyclase family protein [bacterium]